MTTTGTTKKQTHGPEVTDVGAQVQFGFLHEAGAYVCNWSGHLLRIPEGAIKGGRSLRMSFSAKEPLYVTKVSNDPFVPVTRARLAAADFDQPVNF